MLRPSSLFSCWHSDFPEKMRRKKKENMTPARRNVTLKKQQRINSWVTSGLFNLKCRVFWFEVMSVMVLGLCPFPAHLCVVSSSASVYSSLWFFLYSSSVCLFPGPLVSSVFQLLFGFVLTPLYKSLFFLGFVFACVFFFFLLLSLCILDFCFVIKACFLFHNLPPVCLAFGSILAWL